MRSKSTELKRQIYDYVNEWKRENGHSPTLSVLASNFCVSRTTIYRYLVEMTAENMGLIYNGKTIETRELNAENMRLSPALVVGSIPCGEAQEEEAYVEEYINLPASLFGKGELYILRASGDSMEDAGITEGDMVVIRRQETAEVGDIVVALNEDGKNTLKRFGGFDEKHRDILEYMNEAVYPNKVIAVERFTVQGVANHVIKQL